MFLKSASADLMVQSFGSGSRTFVAHGGWVGSGELWVAPFEYLSRDWRVVTYVARGEVDLAFAQVSEFLGVDGLQNLGPLPESLQNYTTYTAALPRDGDNPQTASFLRFITGLAARGSIEAMGMEQPR